MTVPARIILLTAAAASLLGLAFPAAAGESEASVRKAVEQALPYLADEGDIWIEERECSSCHHSGLLIWGHRLAANRGFKVDTERLDEWTSWMLEFQLSPRKDKEGKPLESLTGSTDLEGVSQLVLGGGFSFALRTADDEAQAGYGTLHDLVVAGQQEAGFWKAGGQLPSQKRPALETNTVSSAWAVLAMNAMPGDDAGARHRGLAWLVESGAPLAEAESTERVAVEILLADRFKTPADRDSAVAALLARQNEDGGWSWRTDEPSGPLATGQALYALAECGGADENAQAVRKAWHFLASSQRDDGSWKTLSTKEKNKNRSTEISDFFGSAWAVIGLCRSLPEPGE